LIIKFYTLRISIELVIEVQTSMTGIEPVIEVQTSMTGSLLVIKGQTSVEFFSFCLPLSYSPFSPFLNLPDLD
jgi:hypothetical protein